MVQNRWYTDVHPAAYAHELVHGFGVRDDDAPPQALLTPGGRNTQVLSAGESSLMGKFENPQSHIVITSDHLQQIADVLTPYLPIGARALQDRVAADGAAGGEADAGVERPTTRPATESAALYGGVSPGEVQETSGSGDAAMDEAPAVDYRMVHELDRDYVVESDEGEKLWRFSNHPPEEIFREGFRADNPSNVVDLTRWVSNNPDAQFLSTTRDYELWYGVRRYRYGIDSSLNGDPRGIDVQATLGSSGGHILEAEQEVVFTGSIDARAIVTVYDGDLDRTGRWNPDTDEVEWRDSVHDGPPESLTEFVQALGDEGRSETGRVWRSLVSLWELVRSAPGALLSWYRQAWGSLVDSLRRGWVWFTRARVSGADVLPSSRVGTSTQFAVGDGSGDAVAADMVQQAESNEQTVSEAVDAARRRSPGVLSLERDGQVLSGGVSPDVTQETPVSGDTAVDDAPAVDYRMVHELHQEHLLLGLRPAEGEQDEDAGELSPGHVESEDAYLTLLGASTVSQSADPAPVVDHAIANMPNQEHGAGPADASLQRDLEWATPEGQLTAGASSQLARERAAFEQKLGVHYQADPVALEAARSAVTRLREVLQAAYQGHGAEVVDASFFTGDPTSAGQIGPAPGSSSTAWLDSLLVTGSLREVMTAFLNATGYKALYERDANVPSLNSVLKSVLAEPGRREGVQASAEGLESARALGLDCSALKIYAGFVHGRDRAILEERVAADPATRDKAYLFRQDDPFALGSLAAHTTRGRAKDPLEIVHSQNSRIARSPDLRALGSRKKTPRDYTYLGVPLSDRERTFLWLHEQRRPWDSYDIEDIPLDTLAFDAETGDPVLNEILARPDVVSVHVKRPPLPEAVAGGPGPEILSNVRPPVDEVWALVRGSRTELNMRAGDLKLDGEQGPEFALGWVEGTAYFDLDERSPWYQQWHVDKGMPLIAGVSGTTLRMLRAFQWLNVQHTTMADFRKALMGWMLPGQDHSLFEVMRASHLADATTPAEEEALRGEVTDLYSIPGLVPAQLTAPGGRPATVAADPALSVSSPSNAVAAAADPQAPGEANGDVEKSAWVDFVPTGAGGFEASSDPKELQQIADVLTPHRHASVSTPQVQVTADGSDRDEMASPDAMPAVYSGEPSSNGPIASGEFEPRGSEAAATPQPAPAESSDGPMLVRPEFDDVDVIVRGEVGAGPEEGVAWAGAPVDFRRFEARRYRHSRTGEFISRAVVRIFLDVVADPVRGTPAPEEVRELAEVAQQGVDRVYNQGSRLPNGDRLWVDLEYVTDRAAAHHVVKVHTEFERENSANWSLGLRDEPDVLAHEVGHLLGVEDEYRDGLNFAWRPVYLDGGVMDGPSPVDKGGHPIVDMDHPRKGAGPGRLWLSPRYLRQWGSAIEAAYRRAAGPDSDDAAARHRFRVEGEVVFATDDTYEPREDGLPTRAHFTAETRRAVVYGESGTGAGGYLAPSGMSVRPRPVMLQEEPNRNGTYRAEYATGGGLNSRLVGADWWRPVPDDRFSWKRGRFTVGGVNRRLEPGDWWLPGVGDLDGGSRGEMKFTADVLAPRSATDNWWSLVPDEQHSWTEVDGQDEREAALGTEKRGQMMFPAYWTEDDVVYAGEQAYLDALYHGNVFPLEGWPPGAYIYVGEYAGVRIAGKVLYGYFTGFRPADDQPDQEPPAYAPRPAPPKLTGRAGFGQRVEDVTRYGDRRTRTGAYHAPKKDQRLFHGMWIEAGTKRHDNGTYQAAVWFLDPALNYSHKRRGVTWFREKTEEYSAWVFQVGKEFGPEPRKWHHYDSRIIDRNRWRQHRDGDEHIMFPDEWSAEKLLTAVAQAYKGRKSKLLDDGTEYWVGEAEWVRMEGLARDGRHLAYRPTQVQLHLWWPEEAPIGETDKVPGSVSHGGKIVTFDVQQVLFANGQRGIDLTAQIYLDPTSGTDDALLNDVWEKVEGASRAYDNVARADGAPLVRVSLKRVGNAEGAHHTVTVDRASIQGIRASLPSHLGVRPDAKDLKEFAEKLGGEPAATDWRPPVGTDPSEGQAAIDHALELADPFRRSTTLREPDPTDPGDWATDPGERATDPGDWATDRSGRGAGWVVLRVILEQLRSGGAALWAWVRNSYVGQILASFVDMLRRQFRGSRPTASGASAIDAAVAEDMVQAAEEQTAQQDISAARRALPGTADFRPGESAAGVAESSPRARGAAVPELSTGSRGEMPAAAVAAADAQQVLAGDPGVARLQPAGEPEADPDPKPSEQLESAAEPGDDSPSAPDTGQQKIVFARIETALEVHRPPRIDHSMPSPSLEDGPVRFDDDSRLPEYLTGDGTDDTKGRSYGHSQVTLRGADLALQEISEIVSTHLGGEASTVPGLSEVLADLSQAMHTAPQRFHGDGYQSSAFGNSPVRVLRVVTRPYGNWERFTDLHGEPVKLEVAQRSQVTAGAVQSVGAGRRAARGVSVLPGSGAAAFARLGVTAGSTRTAEYGMQDETVSQVETRTAEASHLHLDDVAYEVSLSGAPETVSSGGRPAGSSTTGETFTFAVRNGLAVRLTDSETLVADPGRVPERMELDARSDYRLVHTEGYGPVRGLAEQLVDGFGVVPGSAAYDYITGLFTSENFHRAADRLAKGNVPSDPLFAEDGSPLGAFVVERVVPGEAELLTESRAAEMRHTIQQTATNERTLSTTSSRGINLTLGPSFDLGPLGSLMAGPSVGYDRSSTHSSTFGGSGGRKIVGRAKNVPTVLYKVQKTVHVRRTGGEVITFDTWSLDRMTHTEARRLAGWDDGTTLRKREPGNEPYAPAYLTKDRPAVLGMSRPEAFIYDSDLVNDEDQRKGWLQAFTDRVIGSAARTYPDLLAPLEDFGDPNHSRWRDREHYNLALRNTLRVMNALSHHRMAGSLEELMTGLVIELDVVPGIVMRPRLSIRIRGVLTGRRYEGTQNDLILRHGAPGTERLDGSQSTTHTRELGADVSLWGFADTVNVSGGYTRRGQNGRGTQYGATASQEQLAISSLPSHLHSYRLELTAEVGGFWRYRSGPRALTLGWLGRQHYLQDEGSTDLVGGSADEFVGRVVLAVPDEYTPATDPDVAEGAVAVEAVELDPAHTRALATRNAAVVSEGHGPDVFGDQPHHTLGVGADERLMDVAVDLMRTVSGASWHFSRPGALPHDAIVRFLQPQLLTGGFDQRSGPVGSRISVIAKGHWRDRVGELVHRMRILNLRVASGPIKLETETGVSSDLRMAESVTAATSSGWTLSGGGTTGGTELSTIAGVQYRRGSSRTESTKVTRTVTSDINRDDSGYKILLSGDVQHDIVASVRPEGFLGPYRNRFNGKQLTFPSSYLGQVSEKAAHQLGILKDGLGDVPRYVSHQWAQTEWWHDHPFGSYPVNSLDTTKVLAAFDEQLQRWNVDEADRERVHSLVTPRAVRALREQMTSTGAAARTRVGRWRTPFIRIGSRAGSLRVELIAGESEFVGLDHGVVMEDTRIATVTRTDGGSSARSRGIGPTAMQQVATVAPGAEPGLGGPESLRPQFGVQTTSSDLTSHGRSRARTKRHIFYAREPHADYRTPYTLRLTLDLGTDRPTLTEEGPVGTLREQVPLSLGVAHTGQADDALGPPSLDDPSGSVVLWPQDSAVLRHIAAWRSARQPHGAQGPIQLPSSGFHVRRIVGLETLREAGVLAIATAYGSSAAPAGSPLTLTGKDLADALEEARSTGLTRPGTGSALALDNATGDAALAAFFEDSATAAGYEVPGLNEGGSTGDYRLYSGPDFTRATLLAVIPVSTMESAERHSAGRAGAEEHTSGFEYSLGGRAAFAANDAGSVAPSASMAGPSTAEAGGQVISGQESAQFNTKVAGRSFVFAIPTDWLGVAEVTRSSPFGPITSRPQAVETQGRIIALVHEDVARELGLINDGNFPSRVADAWTQVVEAGQAWTDADSAYWEQRRALADLQGEERKRKRASMKDLPQRAKAQATMNHLLQQADAAAKEFHRVRAAADRLTRWHQLPAEAHQVGEPELRAGLTEPPPVVFQPVAVAEADSADAERYIVRESTPDGPGRLISPGGDHYTVHDVPTDGDAFFHALAEAVHHAAPDRLTARVDVADRQKIIDGLRRLLADELSNPGARGLLKFTSPDTKDTFSDSELAASGVDFREGSPERREYEDAGHIPLHAELPAEQRQRLARTQLLRRGDTGDDAGWNHGAADLQPSLAARVFGARITVVRADGAFQDFRPLDTVGEGTDEELVHRVPDEELVHMVLLSKDGHYLPALPSGDPRREPPLPAPAERDTNAAALQTGTPSGPGLRPAYSTPPWERGAASTWRAVVTDGKPATLVDPDGTVHELKEPPGDGNGFWSGIADALELAGATASAAEIRQQSIPTSLRLDRERPFTDEELVRAGLSENGILTARLRRADRRLPEDFELTRRQEEALIRQQVFTPRRWDDATERNAAELAAARGLTLTVVAEDGTSRTHAPGDGTSGPRVILWRRGRDYLRAERPMPDPKLVDLLNEPAFVETRVRREHLEAVGMSFSPEEATMWLLAPEIMLQEFQLSVENREALLRAHPDDLFPASVRDAYKRLGPGGNA
ncbi:EndoU domain-containing protein [Streptomyces sp. NPDC017966]|uniref:scabin-related ADP-ribosyltransferase n=1 Tax=Streptomyces sp. NPDC017966 TaxID=3365023 RepID=UPI00379DAEBC